LFCWSVYRLDRGLAIDSLSLSAFLCFLLWGREGLSAALLLLRVSLVHSNIKPTTLFLSYAQSSHQKKERRWIPGGITGDKRYHCSHQNFFMGKTRGKQEKSNQGNSWNEATMNNVRDHTNQHTADHGMCSALPSKVDPGMVKNCAKSIRIITKVQDGWILHLPVQRMCARNPVVGHGLFVFAGV
jgi:hypothetical protein